MPNFRKVLNFKSLLIILFFSCIFTSPLYPKSVSKDSLRVPIDITNYNRPRQALASGQTLSSRRSILTTAAAPFLSLSNLFSADKNDYSPLFIEAGYSDASASDLAKAFHKSYGGQYYSQWDFCARQKASKAGFRGDVKKFIENFYNEFRASGFLNKDNLFLRLLADRIDSAEENVSNAIQASGYSKNKKAQLLGKLVACEVKNMSAYFSLRLAGIDNILPVIAPDHTFLAVHLGGMRYLFVDFSLGKFTEIDLYKYYEARDNYWLLKEEYRLPAAEVEKFRERFAASSEQRDILAGISDEKLLNFFYQHIYLNPNIKSDIAVKITAVPLLNKIGLMYDDLAGNEANILEAARQYGDLKRIGESEIRIARFREEAESRYKKVLAIDPGNLYVQENLGRLYLRANRLQEAGEQFSSAMTLDDRRDLIHLNMGSLYAAQKKWEDAEREQRKALSINPMLSGAYGNLGDALLRQHRFGEAIAVYTEGLQFDKSFYYGIATAYYNLRNNNKNKPEAVKDYNQRIIEALRRFIEAKPEAISVYIELGTVYYDIGNYSQSETVFLEALEKTGPRPSLYSYQLYSALGLTYYKMGKKLQAVENWAKALMLLAEESRNEALSKDIPEDIRGDVMKELKNWSLQAQAKREALPFLVTYRAFRLAL
ncbi:MAG: tetratricopeptide repeat protein [Candidatus Omnitrophota bacterium]|nr:tetratricopeptide repeat protein [Candidatus Omnitrophota bacterium]